MNNDLSVVSTVFSGKTEFKQDVDIILSAVAAQRLGLVAFIQHEFYFGPDQPSGEVGVEFRFAKPIEYQKLLDIISKVVDSHVCHQTLLPVPIVYNKMERDFDR